MAGKKESAISNEEIIAALLQSGTIKAAAEKLGITARSIYDRMDNREFRAEYMEAKSDILRKAVYSINDKLSEAIEAITEIMNDPKNNAATRLQAAQTILNHAGRFSERLAREEYQSRSEKKASILDGIEW